MPYDPIEPQDIPENPNERKRIDEVKLPNGHVYDIKDTLGRRAINIFNSGLDDPTLEVDESDRVAGVNGDVIVQKADKYNAVLTGYPVAPTIDPNDANTKPMQIVNYTFLQGVLEDYSNIKNLVDGQALGSLRGIDTASDKPVGNYSLALGNLSSAQGDSSIAYGYMSEAKGSNSIAGGGQAQANSRNSIAIGARVVAGVDDATGNGAVAIGDQSSATGELSFAFGLQASASGDNSASVGDNTSASAELSRAYGKQTLAAGYAQNVFGEYNIEDASLTPNVRSTYVEIVGNGSASQRSNARTLDWNGNEVLAGKLTLGAQASADNDAVTLLQTNNLIANAIAGAAGNFVSKDGDRMNGPLEIDSADDLLLNLMGNYPALMFNGHEDGEWPHHIVLQMGEHDVESGWRTAVLALRHEPDTTILPTDGSVRLRGVKTPLYDSDAANKLYVDTAVNAMGSLPSVTYEEVRAMIFG